MSDDLTMQDEGADTRDSEAVRDDILKRLLEYQRRQRVEAPPSETATASVWASPQPKTEAAPSPPEATPSEAHAEPEAPAEPQANAVEGLLPPSEVMPGVEGRVERLEAALDRVGSQVSELRRVFQDMAIAADERLAHIESEIQRARAEHEEGS